MKKHTNRHVRRIARQVVGRNTVELQSASEACEINLETPFNEEWDCSSNISDETHANSKRDEQILTVNGTIDDLATNLCDWKQKEKITLQGLSSLLKILRQHEPFQSLPSDARTLLKTPRSTIFKQVLPGSYYHFGLESGIKSAAKNVCLDSSQLQFDINIDGLPLTKSSNSQVWPIQGCLVGDENPFLIGIYHGFTKPASSMEFMEEFTKEYCEISRNEGFFVGNSKVKVKLRCIICDAPAKAFVLNTISHNSFHGCGKCQQIGKYFRRRVVYRRKKYDLRTDEDFDDLLYEDHQISRSPLHGLGIGLVSQTVLDWMHVVCLGVVKKLINLWSRGKNKCRMSSSVLTSVSAHLIRLRIKIPCEFHRRPRSLAESARWKFTELRQFLLYTSIVVLKSRLGREYYKHFLCLFSGIFILATPGSSEEMISYAESLLEYFVGKFQALYGYEFLSYNVHALLHLPEDVRRFGNLDNFSAAKFENFLQRIKKLVQGHSRPLQQIVRRLSEAGDAPVQVNLTQNFTLELEDRSLLSNDEVVECHVFKRIRFPKFLLSSSKKSDSYFKTNDGKILELVQCVTEGTETKLIAKQLLSLTDFFQTPCDSSRLGIYLADMSQMGPQKNVKSMNYYAVVEFVSDDGDDGDVEVIPDLWLIAEDKKCYWPPVRSSAKLTKLIADRAVPQEDWGLCGVKRVFGKYGDYLKAREKAREAEDTSDLNSDAGKRKRRSTMPKKVNSLEVQKVKKIRQVTESSDDSSEIESLPASPPKLPAKLTPSTGTKKLGESSKSLAFPKIRSSISASSASPSQVTSPANSTSTGTKKLGETSKSVAFAKNWPPIYSPSPSLCSQVLSPAHSTERNRTADQQLYRDVSGIKIRLTQIEGTLQLILGQLNSRGSSNDLRKSFGFCFPVNDTNKFHQLEEKLSEESVKNDLFNTFKGIGGDNPGDMTRRILRKIMTDKVATGMNWLGGHGKLPFATTKVICVIKDAVLDFFGTGSGAGTAKGVESATKEWLKQSGNRLKKKSQSSTQGPPSSPSRAQAEDSISDNSFSD